LVPVMPTNRASGRLRASSSMSQTMSTPARRAAAATGCGFGKRCGMPGLITRSATPRQSASRRSAIGSPDSAAALRLASSSSHARTRAPPASSARAEAMPEAPSPMTATVCPRQGTTSITASPQLERRQAHQGQDRGDDPEADDDGGLLPTLLLEMMMQRRHAEDAPPGHLVRRDLDDDRHRFQYEQAADDGQHQLVLGDDADRAERAADRERAGVAHEHHGRRGVEP